MQKQNTKLQFAILSAAVVLNLAVFPVAVLAQTVQEQYQTCLSDVVKNDGMTPNEADAYCSKVYPAGKTSTPAITPPITSPTGDNPSTEPLKSPGDKPTTEPLNKLCTGQGVKYENGLCLPDSPVKGGFASSNNLSELIGKVLKVLLFFSGIVAVVLIVIGGFQYMASAGNEEAAEKGRKTLLNAIIGLVIVILAYAAVNIIVKLVTT